MRLLRRVLTSGYVWAGIAGLILRAVYLREALGRNELIQIPIADAEVYVQWARDIVGGQWLWPEAMHYTPAVPAWLSFWIGVTGWVPWLHFLGFFLLGATQALILGKIAEEIWGRSTGLITAWLAVLYWPWVIFEASYYAEPFAIWNLTLGLYLLVRWSRREPRALLLLAAGFHLALSMLARANAMVCLGALALYLIWRGSREAGRRWWQGVAAAALLLLPATLLSAPILYWNWKLTGTPMLRTGSWMNVYLGNNPAYRGLIVPLGVRWNNFIYLPVRAGVTTDAGQEGFWKDATLALIAKDPAAWSALLLRKTLLLAGRFEISQEIDVYRFREASRLLSLPLLPDWGWIAPLALVGLAAWATTRSRSPREAGLIVLVALAYLASIAPVQVSVRFRLPAVVPLLPLAGFGATILWQAWRQRDRAALVRSGAILLAGFAIVWPDWLASSKEKIINHDLHVGIQRSYAGDAEGALQALARGAEWDPADPDCPLRMGTIELQRGRLTEAEAYLQKARANDLGGFSALLALGECALAQQHPDEARRYAAETLALAPNNLEALDLACRAAAMKGEWQAMASGCQQMQTYVNYPSSVVFTEAYAWVQARDLPQAAKVYTQLARTGRFSAVERTRALFLAGAVTWAGSQDAAKTSQYWQIIKSGPDTFFKPIASYLLGEIAILPPAPDAHAEPYHTMARALRAWAGGEPQGAQRECESILAVRTARQWLPYQRDVLEVLALQMIEQLSQRAGTVAPGRD